MLSMSLAYTIFLFLSSHPRARQNCKIVLAALYAERTVSASRSTRYTNHRKEIKKKKTETNFRDNFICVCWLLCQFC